MIEKVLFVDDDELILSSYERSLRRQFTLETAAGPVQALEKIASAGPYAVIVSDMRMPHMTGLEMLHRARPLSPDSICLILTGNADLRTAIDAVNEGQLFRFLEKPCSNEVMGRVLTAAIEQYRLERSEKELLEKTLQGSVKVLTDVLGLVNPEAFSTASRITLYVKHVSSHFGLSNAWRYEMAAMLSQLGCVVLPTDTLEAVRLRRKLPKDQEVRFAEHPLVAKSLLQSIPRLEEVAAMVGRQREPYQSQPHLPVMESDAETIGAQILKVCIEFEAQVRGGHGHVAAIASLLNQPENYSPEIVSALTTLPIETLPCELHKVNVGNLGLQMVLDEDLRTKDGALLVAKGIEITETLLRRIQNFHQRGSVFGEIRVLMPVSVRKWLERDPANKQ
jgi:response regulator RpfG family c-di-GMP phosphodiesterase